MADRLARVLTTDGQVRGVARDRRGGIHGRRGPDGRVFIVVWLRLRLCRFAEAAPIGDREPALGFRIDHGGKVTHPPAWFQ